MNIASGKLGECGEFHLRLLRAESLIPANCIIRDAIDSQQESKQQEEEKPI